MKRLTSYGKIWQHKKTSKLYGASIDVSTIEELQEYRQVDKELEKTLFIKKEEKASG